MRVRLLTACLICFALTGFAPAPFPNVDRQQTQIDLDHFQGLWKVQSLKIIEATGPPQKIAWSITHVLIEKDNWLFLTILNGRRLRNSSYLIALDSSKIPCAIDFHYPHTKELAMVGIIRRKADRVEILYYSAPTRATSFERPTPHHCLLELQRER